MSRNLRKWMLTAAGGVLMISACAEPDPEPQPRLVVGLVVDQLTPDLLERYDEAWEGGFRRLLEGGHVFSDAVQDHAVTFTSPGHASPTTGLIPARHGVVANSWREWDGDDWSSVSSVVDDDAERVGGSGSGHSPRNLEADGFPDWLLGQYEESRVVSLSGKSTAGVLMAGRTGGGDERAHAYWYSAGDEGFVTSTHYREDLPDWVADFNDGLVDTYGAEECWESQVPDELAPLSRRDTVDYEADGTHTHFPHCVDDDPYDGPAHFISRTPVLDQANLDLAVEAIEAKGLGGGEDPDYLALPLSQTDRVGHAFGPYSREQLDNLMRLDQALGEFLETLDEVVGPDNYVVALTSDHGVLPLPEYLEEEGGYGLRLTSELSDTLEAVAERVGAEPPEPDDDGADVRARMAEELEEVEWVAEAMPLEELEAAHEEVLDSDDLQAPADSFMALYGRSFHPERLHTRPADYGVEVRLTEGTLARGSGTTHGVPYLHDRQVPLLFYGAHVDPGRSQEPARTVDFAPTLGEFLGLEVPDGLDGRPLLP